MLLVVDVGNTNICFGAFKGEELLTEVRLRTDLRLTADEYESALYSLFERRLGAAVVFSKAIVSSVVPPLNPIIQILLKKVWNLEALWVGPGIKTGIQIRIEEPKQAGSDRIVNSVAVKVLYGAPAIVVDFGTATTFDFVSNEGYEGGIIAPGPLLALDALVNNTAKLPKIDLAFPAKAIGKNTVSAMQSGAVYGYLGLVEGLLERIQAEVGKVRFVVATGGLGRLFSEGTKSINHYDPHLTLKGLKILSQLNHDR